MAELRVKDLTGSLNGIVVDIGGQERVIVSGTPNMLWTCSPSEYALETRRVVPHSMTAQEILDLRVVKKL
jgi:hypothetical protein